MPRQQRERGNAKGVAQMAWENRSGNYYYYRKRREGKRVLSEYIGAGLVGEMAEIFDLADRAEAGQARGARLMERTNAEVIDGKINEFEKRVKAITKAVLLVSGYHPHKRQWRKRRDVRRSNQDND